MSFEPSGDSVVILNADGTVMTTLNAVGARVWTELDGVRDAAAIASDLITDYQGITTDELTADIEEFIESLVAADLVDSA